jgi:hypothetical protein
VSNAVAGKKFKLEEEDISDNWRRDASVTTGEGMHQ